MSQINRPKSASAIAEERMIAAEIAKAHEFTAHLRLGPHKKYTARGLRSYEDAKLAADGLNALSLYGRKAIIYAVTKLGSFPCDDALIALARSL